MSGALDRLRRQAVEQLEHCGIYAVTAMEGAPRKGWDGPVAAVSLAKIVCAPGGFRDFLGLRPDPDTGAACELYGRAVEVTLSLDLYAPREGGESACQQAMAIMAETLMFQGVGGLAVEEFIGGRVEFLEREGLYRLPVSCHCKGWLVARMEAGGTFADFEVRGKRI